jgi:hypothetical protein
VGGVHGKHVAQVPNDHGVVRPGVGVRWPRLVDVQSDRVFLK